MKNLKLEVVEDMHPFDPREDDNLTTMICFHRRYNLGDKHSYKHSNYNNWEEMKTDIIKQENAAIIYPLYLYDHSGITISTTPFGDRWDSGQIGFVYISKQSICKNFNVKRITQKVKELATLVLQDEVKVYDKYIMGEAWGFRITDENESEIDSCWGYYEKDIAEMEGKNRLEYLLEN